MTSKAAVSNLLLAATLIAIGGFLCQTISFALDEWLSIGISLPANSSPNEPPDQDVTITAKFGLWEIGVYWSNGNTTNSTSAKLFHPPNTWTDAAPYVADLKPQLLMEDHDSLLAAEVLVSTGMALCFFMAIGMTLHKFAPQLESNLAFLFVSNLAMLFAGVLCLAGGIVYMETTTDYCHKLTKSYEESKTGAAVTYCDVSFVNILAIIGGCIELAGWVTLLVATVYKVMQKRNWQQLS